MTAAAAIGLVGLALGLWPSSAAVGAGRLRQVVAEGSGGEGSGGGGSGRDVVAALRPWTASVARLPDRAYSLLAAALGITVLVPVGVGVSWPLGLVTGVSTGLLVRTAFRSARDRSAVRTDKAALAAVAALADELASGQTTNDALRAAADVAGPGLREAFRAAARAVDVGANPAEVLAGGSAVTSVEAKVATMWKLSMSSGCPIAQAMQTLEAELREDLGYRDRLRALLAGPSSSAALLAGLPVIGLLMGGGVGADPWGVLTGTSVGGGVLLAGAALTAAGLLWTRAIMARARRAA